MDLAAGLAEVDFERELQQAQSSLTAKATSNAVVSGARANSAAASVLSKPAGQVQTVPVEEGNPDQTSKKAKKRQRKEIWSSFGLDSLLLKGIKQLKYNEPTQIQAQTLPISLSGKDIVAMARTGSGKSAAFLLPGLQRILAGTKGLRQKSSAATEGGKSVEQRGSNLKWPRVLVLSPTRELAQQTMKFALQLGRFASCRCALLVGGDSMTAQFEALATAPDLVVSTPGRLMHLLAEIPKDEFSLNAVEYLVFDEADRLFEQGFADQLREILARVSPARQTLLFSATLPRRVAEFARAGLRDPAMIRLDAESKISDQLRLAFFGVQTHAKLGLLLYVLRAVIPTDQQAMVFVATKHQAELLLQFLRACSVPNDCVRAAGSGAGAGGAAKGAKPGGSAAGKYRNRAAADAARETRALQEEDVRTASTGTGGVIAIFGSMDAAARRAHMEVFRRKQARVMIVTDVAARGVDLPLLDNVVQFDMPDQPKLFVHRCGRVARQGRSGTAIQFVSPADAPYLADCAAFLGHDLDDILLPLPGSQEVEPAEQAEVASSGAATEDVSVARLTDSADTAGSGQRQLQYNIATMTPLDVHVGGVPAPVRAALLEEQEQALKHSDTMRSQLKTAARGMQAYRRACREATRRGAAEVRRLERRIFATEHPLLLAQGAAPAPVKSKSSGRRRGKAEAVGAHARRLAQAVADDILSGRGDADQPASSSSSSAAGLAAGADQVTIESLRAFRPKQTILETDGSKVKRDHGAAIMEAARRRHTTRQDLWGKGEALAAARKKERTAERMAAAKKKSPESEDSSASDDENGSSAGETSRVSKGASRSSVHLRSMKRADRGAGKGSKAARRRAALEAAMHLEQAGVGASNIDLATGAFRDPALFVQQGPSAEERREASAMQVHRVANSETATRGGAASGIEGFTRLESSVVDVVADDQKDMAAQQQRLHWDKRKRKYVRLTDGEAADRRGDKRLRTESGAVVRSDGKEHGELYRRWTKDTKRSIGDATNRARGDGDDDAAAVGAAPKMDWRQKGKGRSRAIPLAARAGDISQRRPSAGAGRASGQGRGGSGKGAGSRREQGNGLALDEAGLRRAHAKKQASRKQHQEGMKRHRSKEMRGKRR